LVVLNDEKSTLRFSVELDVFDLKMTNELILKLLF
jgi:hypothetical protein